MRGLKYAIFASLVNRGGGYSPFWKQADRQIDIGFTSWDGLVGFTESVPDERPLVRAVDKESYRVE